VSPRNRRNHQLRKRTQSRTNEAQNPVIDSMTRSRYLIWTRKTQRLDNQIVSVSL